MKRTKGSRNNLFRGDFMILDTNPKNYIQNRDEMTQTAEAYKI